jgi:hypothetical protein
MFQFVITMMIRAKTLELHGVAVRRDCAMFVSRGRRCTIPLLFYRHGVVL